MATSLTAQSLLPPGGLSARYFGDPGGSTSYSYWVQAIYPFGRSVLSATITVGSAQSSLSARNFVTLNWAAMPGAMGYNIFKATSSTVPTIAATLQATVDHNSYTDKGDTANNTNAFVVVDGIRFARARYDFAVDGDPIGPGLITLANSDTIPLGAVVTNATFSVTTAISTGSSPTVACGTSAGSAANSIKTATASSSFSTNAIVSWTGTKFRMSAAGTVTITSATAALTAGVMDILIEYAMAIG